jgi:hypothetical protein
VGPSILDIAQAEQRAFKSSVCQKGHNCGDTKFFPAAYAKMYNIMFKIDKTKTFGIEQLLTQTSAIHKPKKRYH